MPTAGIILCGGDSRRMGQPKWRLAFGDETMIDRIARVLSGVVDVVIVVGPAVGAMPRPAGVGPTIKLARDRVGDRGPLEGVAVGLAVAEEAGCRLSFITACDTPLVRPAFIRRLLQQAVGHDAAVVRTAAGDHPLPAVYAATLLDELEAALARGERRAGALAALGRTRWISGEELRDDDPELASLVNLNTPAEYAAALRRLEPNAAAPH
ncbi:MAG: molybdenum cofactor guanylyltransferase [Planctomycetaceae bacterium]|nr:molybdenum cofactor guanylyltransferase [Planctomycetaceae bacterium]